MEGHGTVRTSLAGKETTSSLVPANLVAVPLADVGETLGRVLTLLNTARCAGGQIKESGIIE